MEVTLAADGSASATYSGYFVGRFTVDSSPGDTRATVECLERTDLVVAEMIGTHTPPESAASGDGHVALEFAQNPDWRIEGEYSPSEMKFDWRLEQVSTGYEGDEPNPLIITDVDYLLLFAAEG